jgi:protein ImuB
MKRFSGSNFAAAKDPEARIQEVLAILRKWGIHTLGQFAALDKEDIGVRLGPEAVRMWERANCQSNRMLKLVRPPESFQESFEFEREIETAEPLLFMLRRFLEQLSLRLTAIYLVAKELTLQITFANPPQNGSAEVDKQMYERVFKIPQPTNDIELLFRMLHTHLEDFRSEHPITGVALTARPIKPPKQQFGLFETILRSPHQLSETLARLTALLGSDRVGTPVLEETHRPDAFRMEPFLYAVVCAVPSGQSSHTLRTAHSTAALRRFRPATPVSVVLDEKRPAHVRSGECRGKVVEQRGPYLASGNWWDETAWVRAEWDLQLENGSVVRAHQSTGSWKIDGVYD